MYIYITANESKKKRELKNKIRVYFLLSVFIFNTFFPTVSFALTSQQQPEFTSYENFNATDMVDLLTGDFTYNIPLLNVPSPEGGFQVPLSYHAGIEVGEESSWVGLGWNINAGAIDRNISNFPDDFSGETVNSTAFNPNIGDGFIENNFLITKYYDSEKGTGGTFSFSNLHFGWGSQKHVGISSLGLEYRDGKLSSFNADEAVLATFNSAMSAAFMFAGPVPSAINSVYGVGVAVGNAMSAKIDNRDKNFGSVQMKLTTDKKGFIGIGSKTSYKFYIKSNAQEQQYGSLYQSNLGYGSPQQAIGGVTTRVCNNSFFGPNSWNKMNEYFSDNDGTSNTSGPSSDMYINYGGEQYHNVRSAIGYAYDNFNVKSMGISGSISPYASTATSFVNALANSYQHSSFNLTNAANTGITFADMDALQHNNFKVNFKYTNEIANYNTNPIIGNINNPSFGFDRVNILNEYNIVNNSPKVCNINGESSGGTILGNLYSSKKHESPRIGYHGEAFEQGRHIAWYSNLEIKTGLAKNLGLMEGDGFFNRDGLPENGIGAFSVTREDGFTFHFSVPVYNKSERSYFTSNGTKFNTINGNPYATTWLLTGITGPDFIDRGTIGIIDANDWGTWVNLNYGKFSSNYNYRTPLFGMENNTYKSGIKETYYLNKISTRTHTAIFEKSLKADGKGFYSKDGYDSGHITLHSTSTDFPVTNRPSSSLKLDNIYVLKNEDYSQLTNSTANGGLNIKLDANLNQTENSTVKNGDKFDYVIDNYDLSSTTAQTFLSKNQLQKIHFNFSYNLCKGTYNSYELPSDESKLIFDSQFGFSKIISGGQITLISGLPLFGKLTLESVDIVGKENSRFFPSYIFNYGSSIKNPNYNRTTHDDWDLYTTSNSQVPTSNGDEWSLRKITMPTGAEINIEYERDQYASVFGITRRHGSSIDISNNSVTLNNYISGYTIGDIIPVTLTYSKWVYNPFCTPLNFCHLGNSTITKNLTISSINGNVISFSQNLLNEYGLHYVTQSLLYEQGHQQFEIITSLNISYNKDLKYGTQYGGNIRCKSITVADENNNQYRTNYLYTKNGTIDGISSGVCSYEPKNVPGREDYSFYNYQDYPITPILYSNVTVENGAVDAGVFKLNSKSSYHFITPKQSMLTQNQSVIRDNKDVYTESYTIGGLFGTDVSKYYDEVFLNYNIFDYTSVIGSVDTVKSYNPDNQLINKMVYEYSNNSTNDIGNNMGIYTENTSMFELFNYYHKSNNCNLCKSTVEDWYQYRLIQTNKVKYPNILKSVTSYQNGISTKKEFKEYDLYSGQATKILSTVGNTEKTEIETTPAYKIYSALGSKMYGMRNKNMKTATAYNVVSVYDQAGNKKRINAEATTYNAVNNYRKYNSSQANFPYQGFENMSIDWNQSQPSNINPSPYQGSYLPNQTYSWKSLPDNDGTIKNSEFVDFRFYNTNDKHWIKTSEITLYDPYSKILESMDINNQYSSVKYGYGNALPVASQGNSRYTGWCFSSAEDKSKDANYFDGEVAGANTQFLSSAYAHTGKYSSKCNSNQFGFVYRGPLNINGFEKTKYRASVWVHQSNIQDAVLYCMLRNSTGSTVLQWEQTRYTDANVIKVGNWYMLNLDVDLAINPNYYHVEFGTLNAPSATSTGGAVYFDDFRVHKVETPIVANVYDKQTSQVTATLDEENFATKFIYDNTGNLTATYKETKQGLKLVSKNSYNFNR